MTLKKLENVVLDTVILGLLAFVGFKYPGTYTWIVDIFKEMTR